MAKKSYRVGDEPLGYPWLHEPLKKYNKPRFEEGDLVELTINGSPWAGKWKCKITSAFHSAAFYSQYVLLVVDEAYPKGWNAVHPYFEDYCVEASRLSPL
jgi:hypothetical protein